MSRTAAAERKALRRHQNEDSHAANSFRTFASRVVAYAIGPKVRLQEQTSWEDARYPLPARLLFQIQRRPLRRSHRRQCEKTLYMTPMEVTHPWLRLQALVAQTSTNQHP